MQENWFYDQVQVTFWTKTIKTRLKNMKFQITEISVCKKLHFEKVFIFYFIFSCGEKNHHFKVEHLLERACVYACARVCGGYATKIPLDATLFMLYRGCGRGSHPDVRVCLLQLVMTSEAGRCAQSQVENPQHEKGSEIH